MRFSSILGTMLCFTLLASACEFFESPAGITKAVTAQSVQGATFEPVGITDNFAPDQNEFHVIVTLTNAPKNSSVRVVWTAVDVGGALAPNTKIDEATVTTEGSRNLDFSLKRKATQWPPRFVQSGNFLERQTRPHAEFHRRRHAAENRNRRGEQVSAGNHPTAQTDRLARASDYGGKRRREQ